MISGFPTSGELIQQDDTGFVWRIDRLAPGQSAELQFRAEARSVGYDVNGVVLQATEVESDLEIEELIAIGG